MTSTLTRIYLPGASGTPASLIKSVFETPNSDITTSFVPGINLLSSEMIRRDSRVSGLFMQATLAAAHCDGRFRHLPLSYFAMAKWLRASPEFDICLVQVSPPDAAGRSSLGPAVEFTESIMRRAKRVVAVVNQAVPRVPHAPTLALADCAEVSEADVPLVGYDAGNADAAAQQIAERVAALIEDGATLQVGLGKVPQCLMNCLQSRRGLRLHSGMLSDGIIGLAESGALACDAEHVTTVVTGTPKLYEWIAQRQDIHLRGVEFTHDPLRLAAIENFVAVNSALEVDLFGQCNLEFVAGSAISGAGGAPDFSRAARLSRGGISIVALPASFGGGKGSRIRARLREDSIVSISRYDVDLVVTEFGVADLRGLSVYERAEAIIAVAAPFARAELTQQWYRLAQKM